MKEGKECVRVYGDYSLCRSRSKEPNPDLAREIGKSVIVTLSPVLTKEDAAYIEKQFPVILFGSIVTALSTAFGFYIYYMIGALDLPSFFDHSLLGILLVAVGLVFMIVLVSFIQYRVSKGLQKARIIESLVLERDDASI